GVAGQIDGLLLDPSQLLLRLVDQATHVAHQGDRLIVQGGVGHGLVHAAARSLVGDKEGGVGDLLAVPLAGAHLDDLAADEAVADELNDGVGAPQAAVLAADLHVHDDGIAGTGGRFDADDLASVDALDADTGALLDAADLLEAGPQRKGAPVEPAEAADG